MTPTSSSQLPPATTNRSPPLPVQHLLQRYTSSHPLRSPSPLPPSSRVNPDLIQRSPPPASSSPLLWTIPTWIAFARFATAKGLHIVQALWSHFRHGPQRKSWGYRMTFIASFMRNVADHTSLADIVLIRRLISLHFIIPLPADAIITPITFVVPLRTGERVARGFLRDLDSKETGKRELSGEWVVGTAVWQRLKREKRARQEEERKKRRLRRLAELNASHPSPGERERTPDVTDVEGDIGRKEGYAGERVIYYIHGGAYYVGNAATHRLITIGVSKACNARVFAITYRLAPEHAFPLPLHDVLHGYLRLLAPPLRIPPENIVIMGDSAGGGLGLALCMYLRDEGYRMPAGLVLMSPWVDLTMSCGSWDENAETDVVPRPETDDHLNPVGCYLGPEGITNYLTHPYASPLFGDLSNLPPMLIQAGDSEVLRDEIALLAHKASLCGAQVTHELYEDMVHVFQMFTWLPGAQAAIRSVGRWVRYTLPLFEAERRSPPVGPLSAQVGESTMGEMDAHATPVDADGEAISGPSVLPGATLDEEMAVRDRDDLQQQQQQGQRPRRLSPLRTALHLDLNVTEQEQTTIDLDSLPSTADADVGAEANVEATHVAEHPAELERPTPDVVDVFGIRGNVPPPLRRAATAVTLTSRPHSPASPTLPPHAQTPSIRRRRPTASGSFTHANASPAASIHAGSNPVSPVPSFRRRNRAATVTQPPTTRARSKSHSDIHQLVEGYVEGGAANTTVVYNPGGEIRSVGVLGEEHEEDEFHWVPMSPSPEWTEDAREL